MNIFRKINIFWMISLAISCLYTVWTYKILLRNDVIKLSELYQTEINEFLMLALIIPVFVGIILKLVTDYMYYSKMLCYGSRRNWQKKVTKQLFITSLKYVFIILGPINVVRIILSKVKNRLEDIYYCIFSIITYVLIFTLISYIALILRIQWNMDILVMVSVLGICFMPYLMTRIFMREQTIPFSDIVNASFLFQGSEYLWFVHKLMCGVIIAVIICIYALMSYQIKNKDLLWRNDEK